MNEKQPLISIIMGIYNCEDTLAEAIDSLLAQTYKNWELIMCDDGSVDQTYDVASQYVKQHPTQMFLLKHEKNQGLNITLNDCLLAAHGEYIARMDGDDISLPTRFEKEMDAFFIEPDLAIVSCPMIYFDENGEWGRGKEKENYPVPAQLVRGTVHCHAAAIIRTDAMCDVGGYSVDDKLLRVEDWHLWIKMYAKGYRGKNIGECLYMMRDDQHALKRKNFQTSKRESALSRYAVKELKLSPLNYVYSMRPILVGLLPPAIYTFLHRAKKNGGSHK